MTKRISGLLGAVAAVALAAGAAPAQAQDVSTLTTGPYVGIEGGGSFPLSADFNEGFVTDKADFNNGWAALGEVGYGFGNGFRTELQGAYFRDGVSSVSSGLPASGRMSVGELLINGIYDFQTGTPFTPHVGAGVGVANVSLHGVQPLSGNVVSGTDNVFGYQGILGVDYAVSPNLKLGLDYHFMGADSGGYGATPNGTRTAASIQTNLITAGLRWEFGAPAEVEQVTQTVAPPPPPPPPPAPVPEAARSFQVFFDFDKSDITSAAANVIRSAATAVKQGHVVQVTVTGHTDTVGSASYNQGLSERRAAAVKQQLVADGVSDGEIQTVGVGKTGLLVPTADGVREPQNRRAEIVLQ
jgi:outer membrane protein OmpA-like peptidoglycan-associated protein